MDRAEFLRELQEALAGEVSPATAAENLRYYDAYIAEEAAKGRDEAEVIEEIGGPRIIARTIIDSQGGGSGSGRPDFGTDSRQAFGDGGWQDTGGYREPDAYYEGRREGAGSGYGRSVFIDLSKWYWKLAVAVAVVFILAVAVMLVMGFLSLVIPLLFAGAVVWAVLALVSWVVRNLFGR